MEFKIKIGNKYFAGFEEKSGSGENVGRGYQLETDKAITDNKGIILSTRSIKDKIGIIVEQMSFHDIPCKNIIIEVLDNE